MDLSQILSIELPFNRVDELINFWGVKSDNIKVALITALYNVSIYRLVAEDQTRISNWLNVYAKHNMIFAQVYLNIKHDKNLNIDEIFINKEFDISNDVPIHVKQFFVLLLKNIQPSDIETIISIMN